jgi:hypothetical protein
MMETFETNNHPNAKTVDALREKSQEWCCGGFHKLLTLESPRVHNFIVNSRYRNPVQLYHKQARACCLTAASRKSICKRRSSNPFTT